MNPRDDTGATAPEQSTAATSGDDSNTAPLNRRNLLRGSALVAGAAGVAVVGSALNAGTAAAADGDPVLQARTNTSVGNTTIAVNGTTGGAKPALRLINTNGPALQLDPLPETFDGELAVGQIAGTRTGPIIGVNYGTQPDDAETTYLATAIDLLQLPVTVAITPERILDTRTTAGRATIIASSASALDTNHRLKAGAWIDIAIEQAGDGILLFAVHLNLTAVTPLTSGYLVVYPPGPKPGTSTVNYPAGQTIANAAFSALNTINNTYAVRIYASATTHVLLDLTGGIIQIDPASLAQSQTAETSPLAAAAHNTRRQLSTKAR